MTEFSKTIATIILAGAVVAPMTTFAATQQLPERGPIPQTRPTQMQVASAATLEIVHREVVSISTSEQEIPEGRMDVRVVGARFLPVQNEKFDIRKPIDEENAALDFAEWVVSTAMQRLFEDDDGDVQVAAVSQ